MPPGNYRVIDLTGDSEDDESPPQANGRNTPVIQVSDDGDLPARGPRKQTGPSASKSLPSHTRRRLSPRSFENAIRNTRRPYQSPIPVAGKTASAPRPSGVDINTPNPTSARDPPEKIKGPMASPRSAPRDSQSIGATHSSSGRRIQASPRLMSKKGGPILTRRRQSSKGTDERSNVNSEAEEIEGLIEEEDSRLLENTPSKPLSQSCESPRTRPGISTRSTNKGSQNPVPSAKELEESLRRCHRDMRDTHATTVRYLLHDAKEANRTTDQFCDSKSPFESLKTIQVKPGSALPNGAVSQSLESFVLKDRSSSNNSKLSKAPRSVLVGKPFKSDVPRVPKYTSLTIVRRNVYSADDEELRFSPYWEYIDSTPEKLQSELESVYSQKARDESRSREHKSQLYSHLDFWLENLNIGISRRILQQYLLQQDSELMARYRKRLPRSFERPLGKDIQEKAAGFSKAFKPVFGLEIRDVLLSKDRLEDMTELVRGSTRRSLEQPPTKTPIDVLETYASLTCLICSAVDCQTHGDYTWERIHDGDEDLENSDAEEGSPKEKQVLQRYTIQPEDLLRKYEERMSKNKDETQSDGRRPKACSPNCYSVQRSLHGDNYEWPENLKNDLRQLLICMTDTGRRPCDISFSLDVPCWQVFREIQLYEKRPQRRASEQPIYDRAKRPEWYDNRRKALKGDWSGVTEAHLLHTRGQANPCAHPGPCTSKCPCVVADILCESMCSCPDDCPRRFTGCSCASSSGKSCISDTCICIQMNRECGPECSTCGAVPRLDPIVRYDDDLFATGCQNVAIQRGVGKRLVMGESQLEGTGYGLYTAEAVQKGCFLSEYTGEVISRGEGDRRGVIYDQKLLSFLFDLNSEKTIDGARLGNKARFMNHADKEKDGLNCAANICLVNGEHRIKFIALRDIDAGEELLFDYGQAFAKKHGLTKKLPKIREGAKKGVVVGAEALDALDGIDSSQRVARGKMTAIRGGHGSSSRGKKDKARKSAPTKGKETEMDAEPPMDGVPLEEDDEEDDYEEAEDEDESEEDDSEDEVRSRRPKRMRMRPLRYTR
ncbi:uncharacterized protein BP5553_09906 [Venustampulla echinocandica]|uniref:SET domain-containing protein n=1 Tax=Venustampulla echinocandica TaxID=2656787 RepID=A0A370TB11_9HELO|nr:uncharacterized protein BP5553_09906 [Venustampulla echinocandica]RDL31117.1 hypothetical protein BP5553_09906 [Venustampulla echinocandica]